MGANCGTVTHKKEKEEPKNVFIVPEPITRGQEQKTPSTPKDDHKVQVNANSNGNASSNTNQVKQNDVRLEEKTIPVLLINYHHEKSEEIFSSKTVKVTTKFKDFLCDIKDKISIKDFDIKNYIYFHNIDETHIEVPFDSDKNLEENFLIPDKNQTTKKQITIFCVYSILDIPENVLQAYSKTNLLGKPLQDEKNESLIVVINDKKDNSFSVQQYYYENFPYVSNFNEQSAYCNSIDTLYVSGGEDVHGGIGDLQNTFFAIDLKKNIVSLLPSLIVERTNHSMIFIPNKYIFIVGGTSQQGNNHVKSVEVYDIEENEIKIDSELNQLRSEATLCCVNHRYLYAFCGYEFSIDFIESFEICDLKKISRKWEKIDFKHNDNIKLEIRFFSVTYYDSCEKLIFLGGTLADDTQADIQYIFNSNDNSIEKFLLGGQSGNNYSLENHSGERFFIPVNYSEQKGITTALMSYVSGYFTLYTHTEKDGITSSSHNDTSILDKSIEDRVQVVNNEEIKLKYLKNNKIVYAAPIKREAANDEIKEEELIASKTAGSKTEDIKEK